MPSVGSQGLAFRVNQESLWLISGSVHYFRLSPGVWRDRLQKAAWAGLNTIETPVPWNFHEIKPGKYEFRREADLEAFLKLAADRGLRVIVRVGPYIGSGWDFGGLPADLAGDSLPSRESTSSREIARDTTGVASRELTPPVPAIREADPAFLERVQSWFAELLPRLASHQLSAGGPVIAVGVEHEYLFPERPRGEAYIAWLAKQVRAAKIDVPILGSSHFHARVKGVLETWADGDDAINGLARLADQQPDAPRIILHLPPGGVDRWGGERRGLKTPSQITGQALRILAEGGMYNWSPFAAGTNPGFWAGRSPRDDAAFLTTTYDCDAMIAEGGALTTKYMAAKSVNLLAACLARFLPLSEAIRLKAELPAGFVLLARRVTAAAAAAAQPAPNPAVATLQGTMLFVVRGETASEASSAEIPIAPERWADLALAGGVNLALDFSADDGLALPLDLHVGRKIRLQHTNCSLLGTWQDRYVFLHAPAGQTAVVTANGTTHEFVVPSPPNLEWREVADGHFLVVMSTATARHTWIDPHRGVTIGAERPHDRPGRSLEAIPHEGIVHIGRDGNPVHFPARSAPGSAAMSPQVTSAAAASAGAAVTALRAPRKVGNWRRLSDVPECNGLGDNWKRLWAPAEAATLGCPRGYLWYRARFDIDRKRTVSLFLPGAEDRAHLWLNGQFLGIWGRGPNASRDPLAIEFEPGSHTLVALLDNLGRFSRRAPLFDRKGLYHPVYHANVLHLSEPVRRPLDGLPPDIKPTWSRERCFHPDPARMSLAEMHFSQPQGRHIHLDIRALPEPCWVFVNDTLVTFFRGRYQAGFDSLVLPAPQQPLNHLRVYFPTPHHRNVSGRFRITDLAENITAKAEWSYKPWTAPDLETDRWSRELRDTSRIRWYAASFPEIKGEEAVFLSVAGLGKGQVLLNGRNLGRYWSVGPQSRLLIPESALAKSNELLIFDEEGRLPGEVQLEFDPAGPFGDPHLPPPPGAANPTGKVGPTGKSAKANGKSQANGRSAKSV